MPTWTTWPASALLAAFGAVCTWTGVKLLTQPVEPTGRPPRRRGGGSPLVEWLRADPARPRWLLRGLGAVLAAVGLLVLLLAARLGLGDPGPR